MYPQQAQDTAWMNCGDDWDYIVSLNPYISIILSGLFLKVRFLAKLKCSHVG